MTMMVDGDYAKERLSVKVVLETFNSFLSVGNMRISTAWGSKVDIENSAVSCLRMERR